MNHLYFQGPSHRIPRYLPAIAFSLVVVLGAVVRIHALGLHSLWGDEFCTWKVSQMPVGESLHWQPELTKPPLYQFAVRGVMTLTARREPRPPDDSPSPKASAKRSGRHGVPSEWHLRLPAAVCGTLAVAAMWWLGSLGGGWLVGASAALLLAIQPLQIDFSQEARPYSILVLGSIVSTAIWYRLVQRHEGEGSKATRQRGNGAWVVAYVVVTTVFFHANYLMVLTAAGQALWVLLIALRQSQISNLKSQVRAMQTAAIALSTTAALCTPMVWHFLRHRTSVFQGLDWIPPPAWSDAFKLLGEISFGRIWVWVLLVPATVWVAGRGIVRFRKRLSRVEIPNRLHELDLSSHHHIATSPNLCGLLLIWLITTWGGLLLISWLAHPGMVARYALPAATPAILLPLLWLGRLDRRLPLIVAAAFVIGTAPAWASRADRVKPGFREMIAFLDEYADPDREVVVAVIERTTSPGWEEMDLLGFEYYRSAKFELRQATEPQSHEATKGEDAEGTEPPATAGKLRHEATKREGKKHPIEVLFLRNGKADGDLSVLVDPRALWLVVFLADARNAIEDAERRVEQIEIEGRLFDQLYFEPYRLIRIAPLGDSATKGDARRGMNVALQ